MNGVLGTSPNAGALGLPRWSWPVVLVYSVFGSACVFVFSLETMIPGLFSTLSLGIGRPWGIATSLFLHESPSHLLLNLGVLLSALVLMLGLIRINVYSKKIVVAFAAFPIMSAMLANALQLLVAPGLVSFGASGVDYAALAAVAMGAVVGVIGSARYHGVRTYFSTGTHLGSFALNAFLLVAFAFFLLAPLGGLLSAGTGVDRMAHFFSFTIGLSLSSVYFLLAS